MKRILSDGGEVAVFVGKMDVANARERYQGVCEALSGSNCKVVELFTDETDRVQAQTNVRTALAKYPNLKGIIGLWSYNGPAAIMVLRSYPGHDVKVVGFDEEAGTLQALRQGEMVCSVAQKPHEIGYRAIKILSKLHRGEMVQIPEDGLISLSVQTLTRENVDQYEQEVHRKLRTIGEDKTRAPVSK